jgi:uncharacterized membrane protein
LKLTKPEWGLIGITAIYLIISPFVFIVVGNFLHFFLILNMILAMIPFLIAKVVARLPDNKKWIKIGLSILWLLFLPNAFYMITDLIYLSNHVYIFQEHLYAPVIYFDDLIPWLALFHIFLGVIISLIWGYHALSIMEGVGMKALSRKLKNGLIIAILLISSVGIYIGRFFRYNSWNLFSVVNIIKDLIASLSFNMVFFILGYMMVLLTLYLLSKVLKNIALSEEK